MPAPEPPAFLDVEAHDGRRYLINVSDIAKVHEVKNKPGCLRICLRTDEPHAGVVVKLSWDELRAQLCGDPNKYSVASPSVSSPSVAFPSERTKDT